MENISKALIIAAELLIAVMVLSLLVYFFKGSSDFSRSYQSIKDNEEIDQFNKNFEKYTVANKTYNIRDVVTVINFARNYNSKQRNPEEYIQVWIGTKNYTVSSISDEEIIEKIKQSQDKKYIINGNPEYFQDGIIKKITYTET